MQYWYDLIESGVRRREGKDWCSISCRSACSAENPNPACVITDPSAQCLFCPIVSEQTVIADGYCHMQQLNPLFQKSTGNAGFAELYWLNVKVTLGIFISKPHSYAFLQTLWASRKIWLLQMLPRLFLLLFPQYACTKISLKMQRKAFSYILARWMTQIIIKGLNYLSSTSWFTTTRSMLQVCTERMCSNTLHSKKKKEGRKKGRREGRKEKEFTYHYATKALKNVAKVMIGCCFLQVANEESSCCFWVKLIYPFIQRTKFILAFCF